MRFSAHPFFLRTSRHTAHLALMAPLLAPLALASPALVHAAGAGTEPAVHHGAADPDAPTAPLTHQSLGPQPPVADAAAQPVPWSQANEAVAAFPRGHADILAWEARERAARRPAAPADPGAGPHHHPAAPGGRP